MKDYITNDRGQVGIGTLIVFIALVLVAAIAAGVLINTAGFLQTQAEQTGEDSSSQVANNINVIGEVGIVNTSTDSEPGINYTKLTVQRSPGSDNVDLSELSIQYVGDNGFANYIYAGADGEDISNVDNPYFIEEVTADSSGDAVMTADADRYQIAIPFATAGEGNITDVNEGDISGISAGGTGGISVADITADLAPGEEAEIQITTADRATRNAFIEVPDTIESDQSEVTL
jgi:flagellin FlaB